MVVNWEQTRARERITVNWYKKHRINGTMMHLVMHFTWAPSWLGKDENRYLVFYPLFSVFVFAGPFCRWIEKRAEPSFPWLAHPGKPWGLCSIAFGTAECRGGWLTTNEAELSPLGKPADLSAGCPVPTDVNGGSSRKPLPLLWKTTRELNRKQENKSKYILGPQVIFFKFKHDSHQNQVTGTIFHRK